MFLTPTASRQDQGVSISPLEHCDPLFPIGSVSRHTDAPPWSPKQEWLKGKLCLPVTGEGDSVA